MARFVLGLGAMDDAPRISLDRPVRCQLPHEIPPWVGGHCTYLVTICTKPRRLDQLCNPQVATAVRTTLQFHHERHRWQLRACVLMPDHLHVIATTAPECDLTRTVTDSKRYLTRIAGVRWQRDFFEHRLRRDEHYAAKADYLRQNPVRAGLVQSPDEWPYFWTW